MSLDTSINIVTLAEVKTYIEGSTTGTTVYDESYNQIVNSVSQYFNEITKRHLKLIDYAPESPDYDGSGSNTLFLNQIPVSTSGATVNVDCYRTFTTDTQVPTTETFVDYPNGRVFLNGYTFTQGMQNIRVSYSAGYSSSNMPYDLRRAALEMVQFYWNRENKKDRIGVRSESFEGGSRSFETDMPWSVIKILENYQVKRYG